MGSIEIQNFYEYLNYLEDINVDKELIQIFNKLLINNCKNENPLNYLDSLTNEQICRAKKFVYNKTKNKINL